MKRIKDPLTRAKRDELEQSIELFQRWLQKTRRLRLRTTGFHIEFRPPEDGDWFMVVDGRRVRFNTAAMKACSYQYYKLVVLHELFHLLVQGVPNKADAKRLRDDFGNNFMTVLDIEADFYTAMYLREVERAPLVDILSLYHQGSRIFGDPMTRMPKVERFMGSILSISNAYFNTARKSAAKTILFLPNLHNVATEERLDVICRSDHFYFMDRPLSNDELLEIRNCYIGSTSYNVRSYTETLIRFASKFLEHDITPQMYRELSKLSLLTVAGTTKADRKAAHALSPTVSLTHVG